MIDRNYKKKVIVIVNGIGIHSETVTDFRAAKRKIYEKGVRGNTYNVKTVTKDGFITNEYIYKYNTSGIIFTKQIYSAWKEDKVKAKEKQFNIFLQL
ncbi:hypothetical protein [Microvirus mar45]|uniref:Uncharacterized protein n=1 Tax=Microvirus mar45 TaxID=2851180 RepID=A0A8F5XPJ7_9VIRU|nr:hypothetical protein [Microvirus mar45]